MPTKTATSVIKMATQSTKSGDLTAKFERLEKEFNEAMAQASAENCAVTMSGYLGCDEEGWMEDEVALTTEAHYTFSLWMQVK